MPPTRGLTDDERQHYFSFLAGAKTTDDSGPKPTLPQVFAANSKPFAAFAQGENFNWMEFNANYGAGDSYDHLTQFGHGDMGGSRPWRSARSADGTGSPGSRFPTRWDRRSRMGRNSAITLTRAA